jgi:hypothetical protein
MDSTTARIARATMTTATLLTIRAFCFVEKLFHFSNTRFKICCIFSGIFYGAMKYGGSKLSMVKAPSEVVDIIMGCIILVIAISQVFKILFRKIGKKKEGK